MRFPRLLLCFLCVGLSFTYVSADEGHAGHDVMIGKVGTVVFPVACAPAARKAFPHAVALLHSFAYEQALGEFTAISQQDPKCAMAYWGVAMTYWRPLWYLPNAEATKNGKAAIEQARSLPAKTERERGFIAALAAFYDAADKSDYRTRSLAYQEAMEKLHQRYPADHEVGAFYALSLLDNAFPPDKGYTKQRKAAAILEKVFTEQPDHPGAAHYIIHSFDNPTLAPEALKAARAYAKIAPSVPHALHMPSHIFTRLGLWDDSISSNLASKAAAQRFGASMHMGSAWDQQLHAMDYLMFAYLQRGHDTEAAGILRELTAMQNVQGTIVSYYAEAAIPARYAVERGQWSTAAALQPAAEATPETRAITYWARALGAAHTRDLATAHGAVKQLESIRDMLAQKQQGYDWASQVEIQRREAAAWLAHVEGENDGAVSLMRSAVDLEDSTDKHPVTPGPVLPAHDLLGDLLMELRQPADALREYQASLKTAPNRFHALSGAARAAEAAGDRQQAHVYYEQLLQVARDGTRPELREAEAVLARK